MSSRSVNNKVNSGNGEINPENAREELERWVNERTRELMETEKESLVSALREVIRKNESNVNAFNLQ